MAYKVLRSKPDLQQLVHRFMEAPLLKRKFPLIGVLNNTLRGKISFEALVDSWPDYSALVLRPVDGAPSSKYFQRYRLVDVNNPEIMKDFLSIPGVLPWDTTFEIRALPSALENAMKEVIVANGSVLSRRHLFYINYVNIMPKQHIRLPEGYYFKPLRPEHAQLVHDNWEFGVVEGREAYEYVRYQIETFPSMAVYTEKHEPASWVVNIFDGNMGFGGTVPEERRKGLSGTVINAYRQKNDNIYTYIPESILASQALMKPEFATALTDSVLYINCTPNSDYFRK